jgi:hypothetical protein
MTDRTKIKELLIEKFKLEEDQFNHSESFNPGFLVVVKDKKHIKPMKNLFVDRLINYDDTNLYQGPSVVATLRVY